MGIVICYRGLKFPCARDWCCMYQFKCPLFKKKCSGVGSSMMLQSHRW